MTFRIPDLNQKYNFTIPLSNQELPTIEQIILERAAVAQAAVDKSQNDVEAYSWLNTGHPLKTSGITPDWDLLALFAGDSSMGEIPIGTVDHAYLASTYLQEVLLAQLTHENLVSMTLDEMDSLRTFCIELKEVREIIDKYNQLRRKISDDRLSERSRAEAVNELALELYRKFNQKKCGWLPFGWVNSQTQSQFLLARIEGNNFTFVTMGPGSCFHTPIIDFDENPVRDANIVNSVDQDYLFQCFKTLSGVNEAELYSPAFFSTILELNVKHACDNGFHADEHNIYKSIPAQLGGVFLEPLPHEKYSDLYVKYSRGSTCIGKVLLRALHLHLIGFFEDKDYSKISIGTDFYKAQKVLIHSHLLVSVCLKLLDKGQFIELTTINRKFLRDIVSNIRDESKKLHLRGQEETTFYKNLIITLNDIEKRLDLCQQTINDTQKRLKTATLPTSISTLSKTDQLISFPPCEKEVQAPVSNVEHAYQTQEMRLVQQSFSPLIGLNFNLSNNLNQLFEAVLHLHLNLTDPASTLNQDLQELTYENRHAWLTLTRNIYFELLSTLPQVIPKDIETASPNFWKMLSKEDQKVIFHNVFYLMRTALLLESKIVRVNHELDPKGLIAIYGSLAIMDLLARLNPENKLDEAAKIAMQSFFLEVRNINFVVPNENWHSKLKELVYYFCDEKDRLYYFSDEKVKRALPESEIWNYLFTEWLLHPEKDMQTIAAREELKSLFTIGLPARENGFPILDENTISASRVLWWQTRLHEDSLYKNPTFSFYLQFIDHAELEGASLVQKLVPLIVETEESDKKVLPAQIHDLRQACWLAQLYTSSGALSNATNLSHAVCGKVLLKVVQKTSLPLSYEIVASVNNVVLNPIVMGKESKLEDPIREKKDEKFSGQLKNIVNKKETSHQIVYENLTIEGLDSDSVNAIRFCACDVYDSLNSALRFAEERLDLLRRDSFRDWVKREILRAGRLPAKMRNISSFGNDLKQFFYKALVECKEVGDWASWFEIATWMEELKVYYDLIRWESGDFPDVRTELLAQINNKKFKTGLVLQSVQTLLLLYKPRFIKDGLKKLPFSLVEDYFTYKVLHAFLLEKEESSNSSSHLVKRCTKAEAFAGYIQGHCVASLKLASAKAINALLNTLLKSVHIVVSDSVWEGEYPLYRNKKNVINLESGEISEVNGEVRSELQEWVKRKNSFIEITEGGKYTSIHKDSLGRFIIYPQQIYVLINDNNITYFTEEGENCSRTVSVPYEIKELLPKYFTQEVICWLHEGKQPCLLIKQNQKVLLTIHLSPWKKPEECTEDALLKLDRQVDANWKKNKENPNQANLGNWQKLVRQTSILKRAMNSRAEDSFYHLGDLVREDGKIHVPTSAVTALSLLFKVFESNPLKIICWKNQNSSAISEVEIETINLKFTDLKDVGKLYIHGTNTYYLTEKTEVPQLPLGMYCLVLKEGNSYKLKLPLVALSKSIKSEQGLQKIEVRQQLTSIEEWVELSLKDGVLSGTYIEEKLYLIYIQAAAHEYEIALDLLHQIRPLKAFNKDALKIMGWIHNLIVPSIKKARPQAVVLLIRLILMMRRDVFKFKVNTLTFITAVEIAEIYKTYLQVQSNLLENKLRVPEEKAFLKLLQELLENENSRKGPLGSTKGDNEVHFRFIDLLWDQLGWTRSISLNEYKLYNDFRRRWMYLSGHVVEVGGQRPTKLPELSLHFKDTSKNLTPLMLLNAFELGSPQVIKGDLHLFYIASSDTAFKNNFFYFYQVLFEGTEDEKKRLKTLLLANTHLKYHSGGSSFRDLLYNLMRSNAALPEVERFLRISSTEKTRNQQLLKLMEKILYISKPKLKMWKEVNKFFETLLTLGGTWITSQLDSAQPSTEATNITPPKLNLDWDVSHLNTIEGYFRSLYDQLLMDYFNSDISKEDLNGPSLEVGRLNNPTLIEHINNDSLLKSRIQSINEDIERYRKEISKTPIFSFKTPKSADECYQKLKNLTEKFKSLLKVQANTILWKANQSCDQTSSLSLFNKQSYIQKGRQKKVTWDDLKVLFDQNDAFQFRRKTYLNDQEAAKLMEEYALLLVNIRHFSRMKLCLYLLDQSLMGGLSSEIIKVRHQQIGDILASACVYIHSIVNRDLLLVEAAKGGFLRVIFGKTTQVSMIKAAVGASSKDTIVKAPTGSGKSDILSKLIARRQLNSGMVLQTVPDSHEMVNAEQSQELWKSYFGREVERFEFDAGHKITRHQLEFDYTDIVEQLAKGTLLNTTHYSSQMFEVYFIWTVLKAGKTIPTAETKAIISGFIHQLRAWCQGTNIIDEPDRKTPLDMVIVSYGTPLKISREHVDLIDNAIEALIDPAISPLVGIQKNQHPMLSKDDFNTIVVPFLVDYLQKKLKIETLLENEFRNFVMGKIPIPLWLPTHPQKESIFLLYGLIAEQLTAALEGYVDNDYGLYKLNFETKKFAGPYLTCNTPNENENGPSQYFNYDSTFLRTLITYLYKGLDFEQTLKTFTLFKADIRKALIEGKRTEEIKDYEKIKELIGDQDLSLAELTEQDIKELYPRIRLNPFLIREYIKKVVADHIHFFNNMIISTPANHNSMFKKTIGLSATPLPIIQMGPKAQIVESEGIEGRSNHLMLKWGNLPDAITIIPDGSPHELLNQTKNILKQDPKICQVVDAGGQFKGLKNEIVADSFADTTVQETIIYFDEQKQVFVLKDVRTKTVLSVGEDILDPEKYLVYLDKARSFATNIEVALGGISEIFLDFKMNKDQFDQALGRTFRDKPYQRKAKLLIQFSHAKIIFGKVEAKNIYELLIYFIHNQQDKKLYLNYLSQKQLLEDILHRPLICLMLGALPDELAKGNIVFEKEINVSKTIFLGKAFERALVTTVSGKAEDMYGKFLSQLPALLELLKDKEKFLGILESLNHVPANLKMYIQQDLEALAASWKNPKIGRQFEMFVKGSQEIGTELKAHEEFRQESKMVKKDVVVDESHPLRKPTFWDPNFNYHTVGWERPHKIKGIAITIEKYVSRLFEEGLHELENFKNWIKIKESRSKFHNVLFKPLRILPIVAYAFTMVGLIFAQIASYILGKKSTSLETRIFRQIDVIENYLPEIYKPLLSKKNSSLFVTNNFMRQYPVVWGERRQRPRSKENMPLHRALVIIDTSLFYGSVTQTILLTPEESEFFDHYLLNHQLSNQKYKNRSLCLYDIRSNSVSRVGNGPTRISNEELQTNEKFIEQILDAKLDYGCTRFTNAEKALILARVKAMSEQNNVSERNRLNLLKSYLTDFVNKESSKKQDEIAKEFEILQKSTTPLPQ